MEKKIVVDGIEWTVVTTEKKAPWISNSLETLGFALFVLAAYELSGRVAAFITLGVILLFVSFVLDGVRVKLPSLRKKRQEKQKPLGEEPLTNREFDSLQQAQG